MYVVIILLQLHILTAEQICYTYVANEIALSS